MGESRQMASMSSDNCPLLPPESATMLAKGHIPPSKCVRMLKFCVAHMCAKWGKSIGKRGSSMSFDAFESRILMHFVPFPRFGIAGAVAC